MNVSGTYTVMMGDRGRLVIPSELRERSGLKEGSSLVLLETPGGLVLRELAPGVTLDEVRAATGAPLDVPHEPAVMRIPADA